MVSYYLKYEDTLSIANNINITITMVVVVVVVNAEI